MEKNILRKQIKEKRSALTKDEVQTLSRIISQNLDGIELFSNAKTVMVYISAFNEVSTLEITKKLLKAEKRVIVPVSDTSTETIIPSYITSMSDLSKGAYGIPEPKQVYRAQLSDIGCILVPGVAFDLNCNRMGFGKGYYDKLLCSTDAVKIGLCYDFQLQESISVEEHDIPMDIIVTEKRILKKRREEK